MLFSKIVVAVDGSESSDKVYDMAAQLAKLTNGKLIIVHVVVPPLPVGGGCFTLMFLALTRYGLIWKKLEGDFYRIILKSQ